MRCMWHLSISISHRHTPGAPPLAIHPLLLPLDNHRVPLGSLLILVQHILDNRGKVTDVLGSVSQTRQGSLVRQWLLSMGDG
jgi:hypothetical protein